MKSPTKLSKTVSCNKQKHNMRYAILLILMIIAFFSCRDVSYQNTLNINVQSDTIITLSNFDNKGNVFKLDFKVKGVLKERIIMTQIIENSFDYKHELIGEIDSVFGGDWYSNTCRLKFENIETPIRLRIDYSFYDL